jgi:hypothetical protein
MSDPGGREHAFVFRTSVGEREIHGCDFVYCDGTEACRSCVSWSARSRPPSLWLRPWAAR